MAKVSWQVLAVTLPKYSEPELELMLEEEITTHKRTAIARRLHQRLCKLRGLRERKALMEMLKK